MKKLIIAILAALVIVTFSACASNGAKDKVDPELAFGAAEANKQMPMMADDDTRIDKVTALPRNTFRYICTLVNIAKEDHDMKALGAAVKQAMQKSMKENADIQVFRDKKTRIEYQFFDKNGEEAFVVSLTYKEY